MSGPLTKDLLLRVFDRLNEKLREADEHGEVYIVGGAMMILAHDAARATDDVDSHIRRGRSAITKAVAEVGDEEGLGKYWLNEAVTLRYMPQEPDRRERAVYSNSHLTIVGASIERMIAMKAARRTAAGPRRPRHPADGSQDRHEGRGPADPRANLRQRADDRGGRPVPDRPIQAKAGRAGRRNWAAADGRVERGEGLAAMTGGTGPKDCLERLEARMRGRELRGHIYFTRRNVVEFATRRARSRDPLDRNIGPAPVRAALAEIAGEAATAGALLKALHDHHGPRGSAPAPTLWNTPDLVVTGAMPSRALCAALEHRGQYDPGTVADLMDETGVDEAEAATMFRKVTGKTDR